MVKKDYKGDHLHIKNRDMSELITNDFDVDNPICIECDNTEYFNSYLYDFDWYLSFFLMLYWFMLPY